MKVLFITNNCIGDAILSTGILHSVVNRYPEASFTIACGSSAAGLFSEVPRLDRVLKISKKKWHLHWVSIWKDCIDTRWDLIIDLRNTWVSRCLFTRKRIVRWSIKKNEFLLSNCANEVNITPTPAPYIWINQAVLKTAMVLLSKKNPILAICPTASWAPKQWPLNHFIQMVNLLTNETGLMADAFVLVIGAPHERTYITPLLEAIPESRRIDMVGCNLQMAAASLKCAHFYIGNDSGLMHLSAAVGTPTVGLFATTSPVKYRPWGDNCSFVCIPEALELSKATLRQLIRSNQLMKMLTVESVLEEVNRLCYKIGSQNHPFCH